MAHQRLTTEQLVNQYKSKVIRTDSAVALAPDRYTRDIFTGNGWRKHSRYRNVRGKLTYISGVRLQQDIVQQVFNA